MTLEHEALMLRYGFEPFQFAYRPSYNIAPSQEVGTIVTRGSVRELQLMRWGLIPSWAKDEKMSARMINARSETVAEKPSFKKPLRLQRCLVPATGYYEWKELPESLPTRKVKVPIYFRLKDGAPFSFAGIWDRWQRFDGKEVVSFAIITTEANEISSPIHHRMPVILKPEDEAVWLDTEVTDLTKLTSLLKPYPSERMELYEVSKLVNSPNNNSPECIDRVA